MRSILSISVICLELGWSIAATATRGGGAFAYSDTSGNRYGGSYDLKDGKVSGTTFGTKDGRKIDGTFGPNDADNVIANKDDLPFVPLNSFQDLDKFIPDYAQSFGNVFPVNWRRAIRSPMFKPFEPLKPFPPLFPPLRPLFQRRPFFHNFPYPMFGYDAAMRHFGFPTYQPGYIPNFDYRLSAPNGVPGLPALPGFQSISMPDIQGLPGFQGINMPDINSMPGFDNSAFASAISGPGFSKQIAAISPGNPQIPNVDVVNFSDKDGQPGFYSVKSSSYSSSSNINGKATNQRGAETTVNKNGDVQTYSVHS